VNGRERATRDVEIERKIPIAAARFRCLAVLRDSYHAQMIRKYNRYRYAFRWSVRVRREGASMSVTIPKYVTRLMSLQPGDDLLVKLTEDGIVLRPREGIRKPKG
jgi:AbrB family looped-hinge helix DNA binding protein